MSRIGFIGLGNMGLPMAQNLIKAGHQVEGVDMSSVQTEKLRAAGGAVAVGGVRAGRAFRRQPGVKASAFTGAVPLGHSGNRARPGRGGDGPPGHPGRAGRPDGS